VVGEGVVQVPLRQVPSSVTRLVAGSQLPARHTVPEG
jgi:hypothetical protein